MTRKTNAPATRLALLALGLGIGGGAIAAVAIPQSKADESEAPSAPVVRTAAAKSDPQHAGAIHLRTRGPVVVAAQVKDVAGGPNWAVRVFEADRTYVDRGKTKTIGRTRCVQLGRIHEGRFGWLDGYGTFRPARISLFGSPTTCGSRRDDLGGKPQIEALHPIVGLGGDTPQLASTVAWGIAGPAAKVVRPSVDGKEREGVFGKDHVILYVGPPSLNATRATVAVRYADGKRVDTDRTRSAGLLDAMDSPSMAKSLPSKQRKRFLQQAAARRRARPSLSTPVFVAARAADPLGGLPYGLPGVRGPKEMCVGYPGRIIGDQVGSVHFGQGTFVEAAVRTMQCPSRGTLTRKRPTTGSSGGADLGQEPMNVAGAPVPQRVARRALPGLRWFSGQAAPDVESITFKTPRDVRTIVPGSPAHAYLVVYDGTFASGTLRTIARFKDGTTSTSSFPLGEF